MAMGIKVKTLPEMWLAGSRTFSDTLENNFCPSCGKDLHSQELGLCKDCKDQKKEDEV